MTRTQTAELDALRGIEAALFHYFRRSVGLDHRRSDLRTLDQLWLDLASRVNAYEQRYATPRRRRQRSQRGAAPRKPAGRSERRRANGRYDAQSANLVGKVGGVLCPCCVA